LPLALGRPVPDFLLNNQHGEDVALSSFRGRQAVGIMFFPFAFSRICTGELRDVRDALADLPRAGVELLAISCDPMFALRAFSDAESLGFPMLSDFWPHGEVARRYAVFDEQRGCALRGTFLVDVQGVLRWKVENTMPDERDWAATKQALLTLRS
jgi:peroxiredoxin